MSRPPISETAVLMTAAHLLVEMYGQDGDVKAPLLHNRARDLALAESAQMAWALAGAVRHFAPADPSTVIPFTPARKLRPVPMPEDPITEVAK